MSIVFVAPDVKHDALNCGRYTSVVALGSSTQFGSAPLHLKFAPPLPPELHARAVETFHVSQFMPIVWRPSTTTFATAVSGRRQSRLAAGVSPSFSENTHFWPQFRKAEYRPRTEML